MNEGPISNGTAVAAGIGRRVGAKLIDLIVMGLTIGGFATSLPYPAAAALGVTWLLASDWAGSPGKWLVRIRAIDAATGRAPTLRQSVLRNAPFVFRATALGVWSAVAGTSGTDLRHDHPIVGGLIALVSLAIVGTILSNASKSPDGRHSLDAGVRVITR